jgi:hypothetical protein
MNGKRARALRKIALNGYHKDEIKDVGYRWNDNGPKRRKSIKLQSWTVRSTYKLLKRKYKLNKLEKAACH